MLRSFRHFAVALALVAGVVLSPRVAQAYTGGPQLVQFIGWDASRARVYFRTIPMDESLDFGTLWYFDLKGAKPGRRISEMWGPKQQAMPPSQAEFNDSLKFAQLAALRKSLIPLVRAEQPALPLQVKVLSRDSVKGLDGWVTRLRVRAYYQVEGSTTIHFTCYGKPDNCITGIYAIPWRTERVCILEFFGYRFDPSAQTETALLVPGIESELKGVTWVNDH